MSDASQDAPVPSRGRRGLAGAAAVVGSATMVSRVLGFARDVVLAQAFGASAAADAFFVAFRLPNLLRRVFAEGAFSQAFVPVLGEVRARSGEDPRPPRELVAHVSGVLGLVLTIVTLAGMLAAPWLILLFAPGFSGEPAQAALAGELLRITFPYLLFISLTACAAGVLNTYGRFAVPALTPTLLNVCLIVAALLVAPRLEVPVMALAWGVFAAGVAQFAVQLPALARIGMLPRPRLDLSHPGVRKVWTLVLPGVLAASVTQLNLLVNTIIGSLLPSGSISWLYYSDRLAELPLGVIGVALGTVVLPTLSAAHGGQDAPRFDATLRWAARTAGWLVLPAALGLAALATPVLATLFMRGAFGPEDVRGAAASLVVYAFALPAWVGVKVLAPGFFSRQDMRTPLRFAVVAFAVNLVVALALFRPLGHVGLALAVTTAAWANAALLLGGLLRGGFWRPGGGWLRYGARVGLACVAMVAVVLALRHAFVDDWIAAAFRERVLALVLAIGGGGLAYLASACLLGARADLVRPGR